MTKTLLPDRLAVQRAVVPWLVRDRKQCEDNLETILGLFAITAAGINAVGLTYCYRCPAANGHYSRTDMLAVHAECPTCKTRYAIHYLLYEPDPRDRVREVVARHLECLDLLDRGDSLRDQDPAASLRLGREAAAICEELGNRAVLSDALALQGRAEAAQGHTSEAEQLFVRQEGLAAEIQDEERIVRSLLARVGAVPRAAEEKMALLERAERVCRARLAQGGQDRFANSYIEASAMRWGLLTSDPVRPGLLSVDRTRLVEVRRLAEERLRIITDLARRLSCPQIIQPAELMLAMSDNLVEQAGGPGGGNHAVSGPAVSATGERPPGKGDPDARAVRPQAASRASQHAPWPGSNVLRRTVLVLRWILVWIAVLVAMYGAVVSSLRWPWASLLGVPVTLIGLTFVVGQFLMLTKLVTVGPCSTCGTRAIHFGKAKVMCPHCWSEDRDARRGDGSTRDP